MFEIEGVYINALYHILNIYRHMSLIWVKYCAGCRGTQNENLIYLGQYSTNAYLCQNRLFLKKLAILR